MRTIHKKKINPVELSPFLTNQMLVSKWTVVLLFSVQSAVVICLAEQRRKITRRGIRVRSVALEVL